MLQVSIERTVIVFLVLPSYHNGITPTSFSLNDLVDAYRYVIMT